MVAMGQFVDTTISPSLAPDERAGDAAALQQIQPCGFLLEMSLDWIVLRASENADDFIGESHVTLIGEPFGRFIQSEPLHDLRNLFSRLSGSTGIARAYRVRLTDDRPRFDIAFQLADGRVLLEGVPSPDQSFGEALSAVGGLAQGLGEHSGDGLIEAAARRMRALTGFDRVTFRTNETTVTSSRSGADFPHETRAIELPPLVFKSDDDPVPMFPRIGPDEPFGSTLLRAPSTEQREELGAQSIAAVMRIPVVVDGRADSEFLCEHLTPRRPSFELHAAAELLAQMVAMQLQIDQLRA